MADLTPGPQRTTSSGDDWPAQAADTIVKVVGQVRDRTTGTAITASRGVVYGILVSLLGLVALVLFCVLIDRGLVVLIDLILGAMGQDRPGRANWMAQVVMGGGFTLVGVYFWKKATSVRPD